MADPGPTRRNGRPTASSISADSIVSSDDAKTEHAPSLSFSGSTHRLASPYLPTTPEIFLLSVYPLVLLIGSVYGTFSNPASSAPYSAERQSFFPVHMAPTYFALKRNIFNIFFVKVGWFWVTAAFAGFFLLHTSLGPPLSPTPKRARALLRYGIVTMYWYLVTQWCFGPPIIDRGFKLTGGKCVAAVEEAREMGTDTDLSTLVTAAACKATKGRWVGGHDISGHVFLLVLGSAFLSLEVLPSMLKGRGMRDKRAIMMSDGTVKSAASEAQPGIIGDESKEMDVPGVGYIVGFHMGVIALSWFMLFMTSAYFHTWFEKTTGLLTAVIGIWTVFFLPRIFPAVRSVIGMPGV